MGGVFQGWVLIWGRCKQSEARWARAPGSFAILIEFLCREMFADVANEVSVTKIREVDTIAIQHF